MDTNPSRSKAYYLGAFLLGALIALLLQGVVHAAAPFRLDRPDDTIGESRGS